ncbi:hypothetical protein BDP27DRAFT_1446471 [Rhodocollybia butyracea]|uniref:F-box domain-containing protein n=1 Tax=Rhodocollybia butyracea TaxID=206335 RepID=A0A9P5PXS8_9AGAR|nr:hypothetical protein BDP27DRAFT_1446471 [Rhodocollybia butyracea]
MAMVRRSVRLRDKVILKAPTHDTPNNCRKRVKENIAGSDSDDDNEPTIRRARKKYKKSHSKPKATRTQGLLGRLAHDVPLEVVFEIFYLLNPGDLLRLARTSRDLRRILMNKTSEIIWRTARKNVKDLPPLPHDLNEPQYADLLYESYCQFCHEHKKRCDVHWSFRIRCCKKCALKTFPPLIKFLSKQPAAYRYLDVLPTGGVIVSDNQDYCMMESVGNNEIAEQFRAEFEMLRTSKARREWISRKQEEAQVTREHCRMFAKWLDKRLWERKHGRQDVC